MEKIINQYETIFVITPNADEEKTKALIEKFKTLIESNGTIESVEEWGKKKLAYPINYLNEGFYTLIKFSSEVDFPAELDRVYNITDGIIRSIVTRIEK